MIKYSIFNLITKARHLFIAALACYTSSVSALTFELPSNGDNVVGKVYHITTRPGDTFSKIGRRYNVGYYSLVEANPGINPTTIEAGTPLIVPARFILPAVERKGIVVNLAELRLYYYPPNGRQVITYPIGIGRDQGWNTPVGLTFISSKTKDPTWIVPESIRKFRASEGVILPKSVAPGPDNPLGGYRMRLAIPSGAFLIHGTNDYTGVGRRSSSGCIRLYPEDAERLFDEVQVKTPVHIINAPYKLGWLNDYLYLEAHLPLEEQQTNYDKDLSPLKALVSTMLRHRAADVDWAAADRIAREQNGIPQEIGIATGPWRKPLIASSPVKRSKPQPAHKKVATATTDKLI